MVIEYYFRSNASRNLTDKFTRGEIRGRFEQWNRNLDLLNENENSL